jgi:hypothetical protein
VKGRPDLLESHHDLLDFKVVFERENPLTLLVVTCILLSGIIRQDDLSRYISVITVCKTYTLVHYIVSGDSILTLKRLHRAYLSIIIQYL